MVLPPAAGAITRLVIGPNEIVQLLAALTGMASGLLERRMEEWEHLEMEIDRLTRGGIYRNNVR